MFCSRCGSENLNDAMFCEKCGNSLGRKHEDIVTEDNQILLEVKPTYEFVRDSLSNVLIMLAVGLPVTAIATLQIGIIGCIIGVSILAIVIGCDIYLRKKQMDNIVYDFYRTKLVYQDSFLNTAEREIKYEDICEIVVAQKVYDRIRNMGCIVLYTKARRAVGLRNVKNVKDYYQAIKQIVNL